ncbi:MAG: single-stranded-DNA-specific exonuclease RecJ [Candidatus Mesenet longicola]|uniref:Single-stranded-DNA-specific exonuclease RecJ n=1 Tax=Candidatus Mesenet longicola TaxID=1892558 RepID=A0A8J3HUD6_9RICK|nr:MAG: single-stranded-DNA-specific exonuclease RecJ [Candidatus Mesenet longicola]
MVEIFVLSHKKIDHLKRLIQNEYLYINVLSNLGIKQKRSVKNALWEVHEVSTRDTTALMQKFNLPEILARVMAARGVTLDTANDFLHPFLRSSLPDPFHLLDMDKAINRIETAIYNNENIVIFGDYDVDGATSSALIKRYLATVGINVAIYIPDRVKEGYGPNTDALLKLRKNGTHLCITVDCGTVAHEPIIAAKNAGLDIIVIDHHLGTEKLPDAVAVINPNRIDEDSPYSYLAAVGVAFLFIVALNKTLRNKGFFSKIAEPDLMQLLDLVALGTVCDVMPIIGLNRALVHQGLKIMSMRKNTGLRILSDILEITERPSVYQLGFIIGPHINAGGRIGQSHFGAHLLSTDNSDEAYDLSLKLKILNDERKTLENEATKEALMQAETLVNSGVNFIMVTGSWHMGIIGIIAGRLKDQFYLPTIVISISHEIGKASARSIPGIDIGAVIFLAKLEGLITEGGGHHMAGGFSIEKDKIDKLHTFFQSKFINSTGNKTIKADGVITVSSINITLWKQLQCLEPFGAGNPEPRFIISGAKIVKPEIIGENHIRCFIADTDKTIRAMAFRAVGTELEKALMQNSLVTILGKISVNYWRGNENVQFLIEDALND